MNLTTNQLVAKWKDEWMVKGDKSIDKFAKLYNISWIIPFEVFIHSYSCSITEEHSYVKNMKHHIDNSMKYLGYTGYVRPVDLSITDIMYKFLDCLMKQGLSIQQFTKMYGINLSGFETFISYYNEEQYIDLIKKYLNGSSDRTLLKSMAIKDAIYTLKCMVDKETKLILFVDYNDTLLESIRSLGATKDLICVILKKKEDPDEFLVSESERNWFILVESEADTIDVDWVLLVSSVIFNKKCNYISIIINSCNIGLKRLSLNIRRDTNKFIVHNKDVSDKSFIESIKLLYLKQ